MKNLRTAIGVAVKRRRRDVGISQEDLSKRASIHSTYIGHIERGAKTPSMSTFIRIARALRLKPQDLMADVWRESRT